MNQDIKQHKVYREIYAMPQLSHKNIVRYYSCWIESVSPSDSEIKKYTQQIQQHYNQQRKNLLRRNTKKIQEVMSEESMSNSSMCLSVNKQFVINENPKKTQKKS